MVLKKIQTLLVYQPSSFLLPPFPEYIVAAGGSYGSSGHHGRDDSLWINLILGCFI
jgi:hypothetical protein